MRLGKHGICRWETRTLDWASRRMEPSWAVISATLVHQISPRTIERSSSQKLYLYGLFTHERWYHQMCLGKHDVCQWDIGIPIVVSRWTLFTLKIIPSDAARKPRCVPVRDRESNSDLSMDSCHLWAEIVRYNSEKSVCASERPSIQ
jgi:hypothetical protein